ncbi:MAG: tRNA (adenosine(37)-N6)-dimethylallyltransferase MiaA [Chthoniobacteraceae bacterium]
MMGSPMAVPADPTLLKGAFFLAGPTAVGKTAVALELAEALGAEIIGADAFQVYQGLDRLTAKPTPDELARVPHHLVGTVPLSETFNVGRYLELARAALEAVRGRGRPAIIVGGTGMYLRALTRGLAELPPTPPELREALIATPLPALVERLQGLDPEGARALDLLNPRRVQRALEICLITGRPFSEFRREWEREIPFHGALLDRERAELYERIDRRAAALFEAGGAVEEVRLALDSGPVSPTARQVIGWNEIEAHLRGELSRNDAIAAISLATRHYAKKQLTWFRREPMLKPVSLSRPEGFEAVLEQARAALG